MSDLISRLRAWLWPLPGAGFPPLGGGAPGPAEEPVRVGTFPAPPAAPELGDCCATCHYCQGVPTQHEHLRCHRMPKVEEVTPAYWCGEYRAKSRAPRFNAVVLAMVLAGLAVASDGHAALPECEAHAVPPTLAEGQSAPLYCDLNNKLQTNATAGSGGTASNFGAAFPSAGTAAGFKDSGGVNMQPGNLDASGRLIVNCGSGCSGASDNTTGSTALGALNAVITVPLTGVNFATFQLQSGGTGVYTVTPQCSFDGGSLYNTNAYILDPVAGILTTTAVIASAQATTDYPIMCPSGASHAQMKVTAYTSGSANWLARATASFGFKTFFGAVTTAAPSYTTGQIAPFSLDTAGNTRTAVSGLPAAAALADATANPTLTKIEVFPTLYNGTTWDLMRASSSSGASNGSVGIPAQAVNCFDGTNYIPNVTVADSDARAVNSSTCRFGAMSYGFNGTTWDRLRVDGSKNLLTALNAAIPAGANTIGAVTQASGPWTENLTQLNGAAVATAASGVQKVGVVGNAGGAMDAAGQNAASPANELLVGCQFNTTPTTITSGNMSPCQLDSSGKLLVNPGTVTIAANSSVNLNQVAGSAVATGHGTAAGSIRVELPTDGTGVVGLNAGSNSIGTVQPGNTANTTPWLMSLIPATSGGLSDYHTVCAASANTANIKASAGQVYGWSIFNNAAYNIFVKLHNTAGTPTAGSGVVKTIGVPAGGGSNIDIANGYALGTGIGISIVKDITDAGTTAVAANDCVVDIHYK